MASTSGYRLPRTVVPSRYELELAPDLAAATFTGSALVTLRVAEETDHVVLNAAELAITAAVLRRDGRPDAPGEVALDETLQRALISWPEPLAPGDGYQLDLTFSGLLNDKLHGFYRSTFTGDDGREHTIACTQFEPADARRAFPCWDEPDLKATFCVSLVIDEQLTAVSNGAEVRATPLGDGTKRVEFSETMVMSTYLVAFLVGPFELTDPVLVDGVPLRVAVVPGRLALSSFAVEAGRHALSFLAGYFDIPYPADKIDHVAIPDFAFGAMENLGCVTYREIALLVDPATASQLELQRVATVISHETAHMWFGDLVTMKWWNGIWLNEAFATFMELKTTDAYDPSWQVWTAFGSGKAAALAIDGLRHTRPVEFEVGPPEEAEGMFDVLTYQKGGAVLRMLEQYLGAETFRRGIARYLDVHRYGNTETGDLWDAIEAVSGEPVRAIMDTWILQGGFPLVAVDLSGDGRTLTVRQQRFLYVGDDPAARWSVPIHLRASVGGTVEHRRLLLDGPEATVTFDQPLDWVVLNDGNWGFYRTKYSPELLGRLTADLQGICDPLERLGLVGDTWAAVVAGAAPLGDWARLVSRLGREQDPDVWSAALAPFGLLDLLVGDEDRAALQSFVRSVAGPAFRALGWDPIPGEPARDGITRSRLILALGTVGADPAVAAEARARWTAFRADPSTLAADVVTATANVLVASGGPAAYAEIQDQYRNAPNPQDKIRYLSALGYASGAAEAQASLDFCLTPEVRAQDLPWLISGVMNGRAGSTLAWAWTTGHWDEIVARLPSSMLIRVLEGITALVDPDPAAEAHRWLAAQDLPVGAVRLAQLEERMDINVALKERLGDRVAAELEAP